MMMFNCPMLLHGDLVHLPRHATWQCACYTGGVVDDVTLMQEIASWRLVYYLPQSCHSPAPL